MEKVRLRLRDHPVRETPVGSVEGALYEWEPATRTFTLTYFGVVQQPQHVPHGAVGILVEFVGTQASAKPLMPPKDPVTRAAWFNGFYKAARVKTVEEALAAAGPAAVGAEEPEIKQGEGFVFVYRRIRKGSKIVCVPFRWAATETAAPLQVWEMLFNLTWCDEQ